MHTYGWDTLAYFALRDDKSFFFSSDGEAVLAYTYLGGYALVSGDPIGARESVDRGCSTSSWRCAPSGPGTRRSSPSARPSMPLYASRGFSQLLPRRRGHPGLRPVHPGRADAARACAPAVRRVGRSYTFQLITESNAAPRLVEQLNAISAKWRGKAPERGFTMSLSQDVAGAGANPEFLLCVALDEDGVPGGFLRVVPAYGPSFGYTLDLMRHDPDAPNGMTEFLIASTAPALGAARRAAAVDELRDVGAAVRRRRPVQPRPAGRRWAVGVLNPFFQIKSLHDFNAKFDPEWLPRVLAYRRAVDLPRVGLLYAGAEGFLALPGIGELLVPKAVGGVASPSAPRAAGLNASISCWPARRGPGSTAAEDRASATVPRSP